MTFSYQKARHTRTQTPRQYASYKSYKPYLRTEFERRCVYCRMPDSLREEDSFGADHYRPQKIFPNLATSYVNLFYCCNRCNSRKGEYWPANGEADAKFIPNPCDHSMWVHMRYRDAEVEGRTPAGAFTVDLLDLNDPQLVEYRRDVLHLAELAEEKISEGRSMQNELKQLHAGGEVSAADFEQAMAEVEEEINKSRRSLARLRGEITAAGLH